jgi:hypothetical protein
MTASDRFFSGKTHRRPALWIQVQVKSSAHVPVHIEDQAPRRPPGPGPAGRQLASERASLFTLRSCRRGTPRTSSPPDLWCCQGSRLPVGTPVGLRLSPVNAGTCGSTEGRPGRRPPRAGEGPWASQQKACPRLVTAQGRSHRGALRQNRRPPPMALRRLHVTCSFLLLSSSERLVVDTNTKPSGLCECIPPDCVAPPSAFFRWYRERYLRALS